MLIATALLALVSAVAAVAAAVLAARAAAPRPAEAHPEIVGRLGGLEREMEQLPREFRSDVSALKQELRQELAALGVDLQTRLGQADQSQAGQLATLRAEAAQGRKEANETLALHVQAFSDAQSRRLSETNAQMKELRERTEGALAVLTKDQGERQEALREQLRVHLDALREGNEKKLEEMRLTVDEKLQGTLEKRLGESFALVSSRLEEVHKGLGEMQGLAAGVGDLKRVLTNVKSRGGWGEVQLGRVLEDAFSPDQFERNFRPNPGSAEAVEFAVRMPGGGEAPCFIPIDSKFPNEAYERLLATQERGDPAEIEREAIALERVVRAEAQRIGKYLNPPRTTDFAIMFLPTEGLYAEVIRRPGLFDDLQRQRRVTVVGPTTLGAFLTSLQMGFRSLAIAQRSSEVWQVLGAAKSEFQKYGDVWDKLGKQLATAQNTVAEAGKRTRAVERKLREVEALDGDGAAELLQLTGPDDEEAEAA